METKVRCLRAPRNLFLSSLRPHRVSFPLEPAIDTTDIRCRTLRPPTVSKMESLGKTGLVTGESDATRESSQCPRVSKKTSPCHQPHSGDGQTIRESPLLLGNSRDGGLLSLLPRPAKVSPAHFGGRKSARRGCRGRRGIRGLLQREISTGVQQSDRRHSAWESVPLLSIAPSRMRNTEPRRGTEITTCGAYGQC